MDSLNLNEILNRTNEENAMKHILRQFEENKQDMSIKRNIYVYGSSGIGKTAFVFDILKQMNYDIVKYDASDIRNKAVIENIAHHYGLKYDFVTLPSFKINPLKVISSLNKHVIINAQFYLTTSSNQTVYYNDYIKLIVQDAQTNPNIIIINFLDGAGWIGRSADYKKIYQDCDYFLNLKTIDKFNGIIKEFFNIN